MLENVGMALGTSREKQMQLIRNNAPRINVLRSLKGWIQEGRLSEGDALPPERELAEQFGVNRAAVRWALQALKDEQLIRYQGPRTRVISARGASLRPDPLLEQAVVVVSSCVIPAGSDYYDPAKIVWAEGVVRGAMQSVVHAGSHLFVLPDEHVAGGFADRVLASKPLGIIIPGVWPSAHAAVVDLLRRADERKVPVVIYGGEAEFASYDRVVSDHEAGAYELTRWLISKGRRRILNVWRSPADDYWYGGRISGFRRAMAEANLDAPEPILVPVIQRPFGSDEFRSQARIFAGHIVEHLVGPHPVDAIMACSDGIAFCIAAACRLCGKTPNVDVAIVGYDDYWSNSPEREIEIGPMATIDKHNWEAGHELFRLLTARLNGELPDEPQCRVIAPSLVITGQ